MTLSEVKVTDTGTKVSSLAETIIKQFWKISLKHSEETANIKDFAIGNLTADSRTPRRTLTIYI